MSAPTRPARASIEEETALHRRIQELTLHAGRIEPRTAPTLAEPPALDRFVVAVGDDPHTDLALRWANELAPVFAKHVTLAHVDLPAADLYYADLYRAYFPPGAADARERAGLQRLELARNEMRDFANIATVQPEGYPVQEIVHVAERERSDLILVGSPPHGAFERWLLRSVAQGVKDHAPCSVLLAKTEPRPGDILCAVDGSSASQRAATLAYRMTRAWGSTLRVLHVLRPPVKGDERAWASHESAVIEKLRFPWHEPRGVEYIFRVGDAARMILDEADRQNPALLVMGSRGLSGLRSLVTGSVTDRVAHHVGTSMIVVK